ncbi:hypothetical protein MNBD_CHLOROFLEXI01-1361 [hydrothermal vent metagenome]|uniref:Uncharacterized protein n=1 Tax=hydrothermal vent metagenome TaxID=652676 RepID=A0A3B0UNR0_9ZZZZ
MIFLIAVGVILLPVLFGGLLAWGSAGFSAVVDVTKEEVENIGKGFNPSVTFGHEVKVDADPEEMLKEARLEAARKAASLPRGANMRIGRKGHVNLRSAGEALEEDAVTAVRIAMHHGWDGARTGAVEAVAVAAAPVAAAPAGKIKLVPGKDYEFIELTDSMSPDEKRKARIANSKAKSAAMKAAKAAGVPAAAPVAAGTPVAAAAAPVAQSVNIEPPEMIELTDSMAPDEKRKARIANSKAKSAFNKALKAAGVNPKEVEIVDGKVVLPGGAAVAAAPAPVAASAAPAPAAAPAATVSNIPKPELVEITDDMPPDEKRKVRIANSKAKSTYNKALKAAGIDPKSVR